MLPTNLRARKGFTLAEILVVLAILAVLAAVLVPVVIQQIRKGDISRVTSDLSAARTGIEGFVADVRRYPGDLTQLTAAITTSDTSALGSADTYPAGLVAKWDGPYLNKAFLGTEPSDSLVSGFGGALISRLGQTSLNSINYLTIMIKGVTEDDFNDIDEAIDGSANSTTGQLRWVGDTLKYLAVPIN